MTWDELNKKYPEARDEMSADRERDFLKDLYDTYETVGFANKFWTPFDLNDEDKSYIGKPFKYLFTTFFLKVSFLYINLELIKLIISLSITHGT